MIRFWLVLALSLPAFSQTRQDALELAHTAAQTLTKNPTQAADSAQQAYDILTTLTDAPAADLAACAGLTARAWRLTDTPEKSHFWFRKALQLSDSPSLRAEFADLLMRTGQLSIARKTLATPPQPPHAQWHQTSAKLYLTCGLPEKAAQEIDHAISALAKDNKESDSNLAALYVDAAGIALRRNLPPASYLKKAEILLRKTETPDPEILSALISVAAQDPELSPEESLTILQGMPLDELPQGARTTFSVTLAEAAARARRPLLVTSFLKEIVLPDNHPLQARVLTLLGDPRGSEVALQWLENTQLDDPETLLGLQRTVDPISPLIGGPLDKLSQTALIAQNFALRKKLHGKVTRPPAQTVFYLLYEKDFQQHYGALIFKPEVIWITLGPADHIHRRIANTLETAERTLAEVSLGATLTVRLTQLWKSVWQPLMPYLDVDKPLAIAPVGMLHNVPWATLRQRNGRYLCQEFARVRILSLVAQFPETPFNNKSLIAGTSVQPTQMTELAALPGVLDELNAISENPLLNPGKEQLLKMMSRRPRMIHLAGHGFVNDQGGFQAGLALKDDLLFAREIMQLDLTGTQLVILSACRGGVGESEVGGSWSSLRRSFIAAGAQAVLASQWRVRDDELPTWMSAFHSGLKGSSPSETLWQLQKKWIEDPLRGHEERRAASAGAWVLETRE